MKELFNNLMELANDDNTPFYYTLQTLGEEYYLIFSYHFTDRESWLLPDALEARGIMFEVSRDIKMIRIASRPMQKFFNQGEVDFIEYGVPVTIMDKADGSLISTYLTGGDAGEVKLKSKGSLHSDHCVAAMEYLNSPRNIMFKTFLTMMEDDGYTVNMEWTSPDPKFRIVLHYPEEKLIILNARHRVTGEYYDQEVLKDRMAGRVIDVNNYDVLNNIDTVTGVEGYVIIDDNDNWYKLKTPWYLERHRAKDFINQPLAFVELVLKEEADDVLGLIFDQPALHEEMIAIQHQIVNRANEIVNNVTKYYNTNKELDRKEYAIKGQSELEGFEFPFAMRFYSNRSEPDWTAMLLQVVKKIIWY